ncbi:Putative transport protein YhhT [Neolewinella maritima]|uniref:Transport protein YhhT n=1 Tax=Neolewinella maritima TaxID=1383882 RepID=A0ABM9AZ16_9BACT|nr:AI-2E family transporter [Neolewinella maritima]CAH0999533.1 Putative transport protein YhhT [Neolewinella maritima]
MSITRVAAWLITIGLILTLIVVGKSYLVPIFVALVFWYLVNALNDQFQHLPLGRLRLPNSVTLIMSLVFIGLGLYFISDMIVNTVNGFVQESDVYLPRIEQQIERVYVNMGIQRPPPSISELQIGQELLANFALVFSGITSAAKGIALVLLYVLFFLIEQGSFPKKMRALGLDMRSSTRLAFVLKEINTAMRTYLGVKTLTSIATGVLCFAIFQILGLDYALFWAFLIFLFNYVPTIGSITATALPALLALVQFETLTPFLVIIIGVTVVQLLVGNIIEPRLMGSTLNISPLVVVLSLILWSMLWGIVGMLLSVPITVAIIIITAQFPQTRPVAILLSRNGDVNTRKLKRPGRSRTEREQEIPLEQDGKVA